MSPQKGAGRALLEIIPAIDLKDGRCVRLYQGDFAQETLFEEPVAAALRWQAEGAQRLHIVDLDGAAAGRLVNLGIVRELAARATVPIQVGGGVRDLEMVQQLLTLGAQRVVLGTAAVESPTLVAEALARFGPEAVVVSVDAREGRVAVQGWTKTTERGALAVMQELARQGVKRFIYTDILRDGTMTEPNFTAIGELVARVGVPILAAGGIASQAHLVRLAGLGVEGAIVGTALYTGAISLPQALKAVASRPAR
jgi:phosphoribosylformimino-5-aminoimidazole carboxamide ribotide isomerase